MATPRRTAFRGRARERQILDQLLDDVRDGQSAVLVIRGEAGVGKSALLRYAARQAAGFRIAEIAGVESEMELAYAGLHQLCSPMLRDLDALPEPQQRALRVAFGLSSGDVGDRFMVALATLSLLAHVAEERPLLCLVEDAQWLDDASSQVIGFVARRLRAESVAMIVAVREPSPARELSGLPDLPLQGLADADARALLATVIPGRFDERVLDRIVAETRGNPLALIELTRGISGADLAGGFALPSTMDVPQQIEEAFERRLRELPAATQQLMLVAAADPVGDATIVWRAAQTVAVTRAAAEPAITAQLLEIGARVRFRHPLVRSAVYRSAAPAERRAAHAALAAATDPDTDPDRRAWHRAQASEGPDEELAGELERSADRAQARGGLAAAAAFLERAADLTVDPVRRVERMLVAAQVDLQAGVFDAALGLLAAAESEDLDELTMARVALVRGRLASAADYGRHAPVQLLEAATRLAALDAALARDTYLDAWGAALFAGRLANVGGALAEVSRAARASPRQSGPPGPTDTLLDGLATLVTDGREAATPALREAARAFRADEVSQQAWLHWGVLASSAAVTVWDFESWDAISGRQITIAREAGALALLSIALSGHAMIATWSGELDVATVLSAEHEAVKEATGIVVSNYGAMLLAAYQGRSDEAARLAAATIDDAVGRGEGLGIQLAHWTTAVLDNGLGRYREALAAAELASDHDAGLYISAWALPELVEAAVRTGNAPAAAAAMSRLSDETAVGDVDWARGIAARTAALLASGPAAEELHREAIERLARTRLRTELARAHLLHGEWLRRENRRVDARQHLHAAHDLFVAMGADGFGERARRELLATGEKVRRRRDDSGTALTAQEEHIARLAREGRTNPEIGAELFISARTVEWHLRKVFTKLGITSRKGLEAALSGRVRTASPA